MQNEKLGILNDKARSLPLTPGVYIMKDSTGAIIYIGKAKSLRKRVSQYFTLQSTPIGELPRAAGNPDNLPYVKKVTGMVEKVDDFDYILTDSECEALVLECSLIKQHTPKYNILLKDDKGYHYIKITNGSWKNIYESKQKLDDGATYLGPYVSGYSVTNAVDEAKKIFRLPQCSKQFPRDCKSSRPCLNFFIKQCSAPCAGKITMEAHNEAVDAAVDFIKNGSEKVIDRLTAEMLDASENLEFEKAAKLRDRINAIKKVGEKQKVVCTSVKEQDVFAIVRASQDQGSAKACLSVLRFADSRLFDSEYFIMDLPESLPEARHELLCDYYTMRTDIPARVTIDGDVADANVIEEWLTVQKGRKVSISIPQRGEQQQIVEMCRSNAAQKLASHTGRSGKSTAALDELGTLLGLKEPPEYIEAYDISHTAGSDNVAGMIVFRSGIPYKKAYRHFSIKGFTGQDDYASMAEVIERRILRYFEEKDTGEGFGRLPDLILLDGSTGQVNAVRPVLEKYNLDIPLFGMVKDSHHRTRAIAADGGEIALTSKRSAFTLVGSIQEEVHRFAIEYHRSKHKTSGLTSALLSVDGIGKARAAELMKKFKTIKAISEASVQEITQVKGMSEKSAQAVYDAFHQ